MHVSYRTFNPDVNEQFSDILEHLLPRQVARSKQFDVNIKETQNGYHLEAYLPGFKKEDVTVNVDKGLLTIEAKKEEQSQEETHKWLLKERHSNTLHRTFELHQDIDTDKIDAKFENGVLTLNLVKTVKEVKKIQIS